MRFQLTLPITIIPCQAKLPPSPLKTFQNPQIAFGSRSWFYPRFRTRKGVECRVPSLWTVVWVKATGSGTFDAPTMARTAKTTRECGRKGRARNGGIQGHESASVLGGLRSRTWVGSNYMRAPERSIVESDPRSETVFRYWGWFSFVMHGEDTGHISLNKHQGLSLSVSLF
jgi:hypothetical protein